MEDAEARSDAAAGAGPAVYTCPSCSERSEFEHVPGDGLLECPACGAQFFAPRDGAESDSGPDHGDDEAEFQGAEDRSDELDGLRIRQLSALRRATSRQRSYVLIGWVACLVAVIQLLWMTVQHVRMAGWDRRPIAYLMFAAAGLLGSVLFMRRAREYTRELSRSALTEPEAAPDFSTLSDGSQRVRNLEEM